MERMKWWLRAVALVVLALGFLQGCASEDKELTRSMAQITRVEAPTFLTAEVANAFGAAAFSAHVDVRHNPGDARPWMTGDLFGRDGNLLFIPDMPGSKKGAGKTFSLWDAATKTAYLVNDPLQAYAPIRSPAGKDLIVARDVNGIPTRIQLTNAPTSVTLELSRIRMQAPPASEFAALDGLKAYPTTEALLNDLMRRRSEAIDGTLRVKRQRVEDMMMPDDPLKAPMQKN